MSTFPVVEKSGNKAGIAGGNHLGDRRYRLNVIRGSDRLRKARVWQLDGEIIELSPLTRLINHRPLLLPRAIKEKSNGIVITSSQIFVAVKI